MNQSPYSKTQLRRTSEHTANRFTDRILRVFRFDATVYDEVRRDRNALSQAMCIVLLGDLATFVGVFLENVRSPLAERVPPHLIVLILPLVLIVWVASTVLLYFVGAVVFRGPNTETDFVQVVTVFGFASAPGIFALSERIPVIGPFLFAVVTVWMSVLQVVAIREVFDYSSMWNAAGVWLAYLAAIFVLFFLVFGLAALVVFMLAWR